MVFAVRRSLRIDEACKSALRSRFLSSRLGEANEHLLQFHGGINTDMKVGVMMSKQKTENTRK
jgi:hypothetical protein